MVGGYVLKLEKKALFTMEETRERKKRDRERLVSSEDKAKTVDLSTVTFIAS